MPVKTPLQWVERAFLSVGMAAAAVFIWMSVPAVLTRVASARQPQATQDAAEIPASAIGAAYLHGASDAADGSLLGTITVPEIHLRAPVVEGITDKDLRRGVGHVPGSAQGGGLGNMVLAAHRDTIFRPLRSIQKGMDVQISGADGTFHYRVDSMQVVTPERLDVLDIASEPQITLITCYPFNFIGSAPMRFVVKAHLVSALPDAAAE